MKKELTRRQRNQLALIGAALVDPAGAADSIRRLAPIMFDEGPLREIFTAIYQLTMAGRGVDPVLVANITGNDNKRLIAYAAETVPSVSHVSDYEAAVFEDYRIDLLGQAVEKAKADIAFGAVSDAVCLELRKALRMQDAYAGMQQDGTAREFDAVLDEVLKDLQTPDTSLKLGWKELDRFGMLERGNTVVIGGRPGNGKTDFSINLAARLSRNYRVYYLTLEETRKKLMARILSKVTRVDAARLRDKRLADDELLTISRAADAIRRQQNMIFDDGTNLTVEGIRAKLLRFKPAVAFIDHIGLISPSDPRKNEYERLSEATRELKLMAKQMGIVIVELCQLSRSSAKDGMRFASLGDLRGSGTIEQDANVVMFVQNNPADAEEIHGADSFRRVGLMIAKNREGGLGVVEMQWQPQYHDWRPAEPTQEEMAAADPFPSK